MELDDYLLPIESIDWMQLFEEWKWLIPPGTGIQPWMMNTFGDLFWIDEQEQINLLNVSDGTNEIIAQSEEEFFEKLDEEDNLNLWYLIDLVDELLDAEHAPQDNECYGFKLLPVLGGDFQNENIYISDIAEYWSFCGQIHRQLDGLPDGAEIEIEIPERDGID